MNNTRQSLPFLYVTVVTANTTFNVIVTCLIVLIIIGEEYNTYLWCQGVPLGSGSALYTPMPSTLTEDGEK